MASRFSSRWDKLCSDEIPCGSVVACRIAHESKAHVKHGSMRYDVYLGLRRSCYSMFKLSEKGSKILPSVSLPYPPHTAGSHS